MTVYDIIYEYLVENLYDGLSNGDHGCACERDELFPCGREILGCIPGYKIPCDCGEHDYHISPEKDSKSNYKED